jgi:hypothetical protein
MLPTVPATRGVLRDVENEKRAELSSAVTVMLPCVPTIEEV